VHVRIRNGCSSQDEQEEGAAALHGRAARVFASFPYITVFQFTWIVIFCSQTAASMGHAAALFKAGRMHEQAEGTHPDLFVAAD
jgi:hypothetical protein